MTSRSVTSIAALLAITLAFSGCVSAPAPAPSPTPPKPVNLTEAAVRLLGPGVTVDTLDTRDTEGSPPEAYLAVTVESTPSAEAVMDVLSTMCERYAREDRWLRLQVVLPEGTPGDQVVFSLSYNPTEATVTANSGNTSIASQQLILLRGRGHSHVWHSSGGEMTLASGISPKSISAAASGRGDVLAKLKSEVPLK